MRKMIYLVGISEFGFRNSDLKTLVAPKSEFRTRQRGPYPSFRVRETLRPPWSRRLSQQIFRSPVRESTGPKENLPVLETTPPLRGRSCKQSPGRRHEPVWGSALYRRRPWH